MASNVFWREQVRTARDGVAVSDAGTAETGFVEAPAAAALLGVSIPTLYTYVSRAKVGRFIAPETGKSLFSTAELAVFVSRRERGRRPDRVALASLDFGLPVMQSSISSIAGGQLFYRGINAVDVSRLATLENVAELLWGSKLAGPDGLELPWHLSGSGLGQAFTGWLLGNAHDSANVQDWSQDMARPHVERILRAAAVLATGSADCTSAHERLAAGFGQGESVSNMVRIALVLHADHELNTSAFATRCVASTGASPYAAIAAGVLATTGHRHADFAHVRAFIEGLLAQPGEFTSDRLRALPRIPGFGHPLYPGGDPRAACLLDEFHRQSAATTRIERIDDVIHAVVSARGQLPKNDFAMAAMEVIFDLPPGAARSIFLLARIIGWSAHVLEQYSEGSLIRPRASPVGAH